MTRLDLRGLTHRYDGTAAVLDEVDLTVAELEMVAVVGPSGTGKSTLLRIAAGLVAPDAGTVALAGRDVTRTPTEQRDVTVMFQRPHLFEHLDVTGNVAFGPRARGAGRSQARALAQRYLRLVQLEDVAGRSPRDLSGGQQQRVALARALACERGVLLLDEPFSSLDPGLRSQMHDLLATVRKELSPTVLMVTHDIDEASLADRVAVLADGRLHQVAPATELYTRPASLAVAHLLGGFHEVDGELVDGVHVSAYGRVRVDQECRASGPATVLLRREHLRLVPVGEAGAHVDEHEGFSRCGVVAGVRLTGPRQTVTVDCEGTSVAVELEPGRAAYVGEAVVVRLTPGVHPWALAT